MGQIKNIHFIGIGGAGMSGIAEVLHNEGYHVTGSDLSANAVVTRLQSLGIHIWTGHKAEHVQQADVVVQSTAVQLDNPELIEAKAQGIPVIPRAAMLAELMRFKHGIAVAGTHGKTTTTSLVSHLLAEGGLDPSYVIGGKLNNTGNNAQLGKTPYFVAEADESDASFLFLKPMMAIVTNIDADHMSTYSHNFEHLKQTFVEFLHHLPFYGLAVLCADDKNIQSILPKIERPIRTYGFTETALYRATDWTQKELHSHFTVHRPAPHASLHIDFPWPGRHNVQNALAAIAIATELGVSDKAICNGLLTFKGVGRRFQLLGTCQFSHGAALVIDDYGHHPQEITATIDAFRHVWPNRRLLHVFQPHRFSRTRDLLPEFVQALTLADELLLLDIYSAGESPISGIDSPTLVGMIKKQHPHVRLVTAEDLQAQLNTLVTDGCAILMQGAGSVGQMAQAFVYDK
ncbi:MAG: UDP-N-acetylmuramate--L-alanine ligase [Gammaproteobacteria bacterium]|nr:UDP-N-acetylmuramate--L-alanine ligase [Gammaproteobacteria bacterium]